MVARKGIKPGSNNCYARQRRLEDYLRSKRFPATYAELAEYIGRSVRTVHRDLKALEDAGHVIERSANEQGDGAGEHRMVRLLSRNNLKLELTLGEGYMANAMCTLVEPLKGTCLYDRAKSIRDKVALALPTNEHKALITDRHRFYVVPTAGMRSYESKAREIEALERAVIERRVVQYEYRSWRGHASSGRMEPHALVMYNQALYVLGHCVALGDGPAPRFKWIRWPIERFTRISLESTTFIVDPSFDVTDHFDGFGILREGDPVTVVVDFSPKVAGLIADRVWHRDQSLTLLSDGWLRLTFPTSNLTEATSCVLGFGGEAIVRSPAKLRDAVIAHCSTVLLLSMERGLLTSVDPVPLPVPPGASANDESALAGPIGIVKDAKPGDPRAQ